MGQATPVRSHAIFANDAFYDWNITNPGESTNRLKTEYRSLDIQGKAELEDFLADKTLKPVNELTSKEWQIIHTYEARLTLELSGRQEAIAYLQQFLKDSQEGNLSYEPNYMLTNTLEHILAILPDEEEPVEDILSWFDQAVIFSRVNY